MVNSETGLTGPVAPNPAALANRIVGGIAMSQLQPMVDENATETSPKPSIVTLTSAHAGREKLKMTTSKCVDNCYENQKLY